MLMDSPVSGTQGMGSRGFTLIEMMIVVTVVILAAVMGIPSYRNMLLNTQTYNAAQSYQAGLQKAQAEAIKFNGKVEFVIGSSYLWRIQLPNNNVKCPNVNNTTLLDCATNEGAKNVIRKATLEDTTQTSSFSDDPAQPSPTISFGSLGTVTGNANASSTLRQIDFSTDTGSRKLRVMIGINGAGNTLRMCDPGLDPATSTDPRKC